MDKFEARADTVMLGEAIHENRQRYSRAFNHDLKAIFSDLRKQQDESGRKVVNLSRQKDLTIRWK